ncbi:MAG: hypothetical protein H5U02_04925 [Clostridia bacterium]|nr:hypothetical protein [Clostridia bacterium]
MKVLRGQGEGQYYTFQSEWTEMFKAELFYEWNGELLPLPEWCGFFFRLGSIAAAARDPGKRLVVALSVPTRAYAACFVAAGTVIARAPLPVRDLPEPDEHFDRLCRLKIGTPLVYRKGNRKFKGIFAGVTALNNGETRIKVQIANKEGGNLTELLNKEMSLAVSIATIDDIKLPKKQAGRKIVRRKSFLDSILGKVDSCGFTVTSRMECAILGPVGVLRREVTETRLSIRGPGGFARGTLQDILRVRRFLSEGKAFRTEIYPASRNMPPRLEKGSDPCVVIFDGAAGFLKWRDNWRISNWIVLLDRTGPNFREAVEIVNQEFIKNRIGNCPELDIPPVPRGIEIIVYEEGRR